MARDDSILDFKIISGEEMRSDSHEGNQAQRDRLRKGAIERMDRSEHWILVCFEKQEEKGYHASWMGICSQQGTKMRTLNFLLHMLARGQTMVAEVMAMHAREEASKRDAKGGQ